MTTFVWIRHAAHDLLGKTIVGRAPGVHLSAAGLRQAEALAARLGDGALEALYSSPLERALETAAPIGARCGLEVTVADELNEIEFGAWTGRTFAALDRIEAWRRFNRFRSGVRIPRARRCSRCRRGFSA